MKYSLIEQDGNANITVVAVRDGKPELFSATHEHPNWNAIVEGVRSDDESVVDLFDPARTVARRFERISDRITVANGKVYVDGDEIHNALTEQILRFLEEGLDFQPLVNFYDKIAANPNEHSREQLYRWLQTHDFTITPEGNFIGYKGVRVNAEGGYESINHGPAIVNGEEVNGAVPNPIGGIVEIPRSQVEHNPGVGCAFGLHVGTWEYASGFSQGAVLKCEVNPRDVVSVPTDCADAKVRTCRYKVLEVIDQPVAKALDMSGFTTVYDSEEDGGHDVCFECGNCIDCEGCECDEICDECGGYIDYCGGCLDDEEDDDDPYYV